MGEAEETNFGGWVGRSSSRLARSQDRFLEDGVVAVVEKQWYRPAQHALQVRDGWWSWSIQAGGEGEAWLAAGPPVGQASDVVLPLHSLIEEERCDLIGGAGGDGASEGRLGRAVRG